MTTSPTDKLAASWSALCTEEHWTGDDARSIGADLVMRLGEPHRRYHTGAHIAALLGHLASARDQIRDHGAVALAIWLHDAIYDPQAAENELKSAALAAEIAHRLNVSSERRRAVEAMILATVGHTPSQGCDDDLLHFLDFDLSIFGAPPATYDAYAAAIRDEYRHVPDDAFRVGRRAVLERFLMRQSLYFTVFGQSRWEAPARQNLVREIASLR